MAMYMLRPRSSQRAWRWIISAPAPLRCVPRFCKMQRCSDDDCYACWTFVGCRTSFTDAAPDLLAHLRTCGQTRMTHRRRLRNRGAVADDLLVVRREGVAVSVLNLEARSRGRKQHSEEDMTSCQPLGMVIVARATVHTDAEPQLLIL